MLWKKELLQVEMEYSHFLISFGPSHAKVEVSEPVPRTGDSLCHAYGPPVEMSWLFAMFEQVL